MGDRPLLLVGCRALGPMVGKPDAHPRPVVLD
jgi:hypothetical protein